MLLCIVAYGKVVDMKITRKTGPHTLPVSGLELICIP